MLSQWGWRLFQIAIVGRIGIAFHTADPKASPLAVMIFGVLTAALATGLLAGLFRLIRRALGRETVEDREWKNWRPGSNLPRWRTATSYELVDPPRVRHRAPR